MGLVNLIFLHEEMPSIKHKRNQMVLQQGGIVSDNLTSFLEEEPIMSDNDAPRVNDAHYIRNLSLSTGTNKTFRKIGSLITHRIFYLCLL